VDAFLSGAWDVILALVPPIFVGGIFWIVMRAILRADRTERNAYAKIEAQELAKFEADKQTDKQAGKQAAKASAAEGEASSSKKK
jgi:hypothetical protein